MQTNCFGLLPHDSLILVLVDNRVLVIRISVSNCLDSESLAFCTLFGNIASDCRDSETVVN